jgi:hypothetical protein
MIKIKKICLIMIMDQTRPWLVILVILVVIVCLYYWSRGPAKNTPVVIDHNDNGIFSADVIEAYDPSSEVGFANVTPVEYDFSDVHANLPEFTGYGPGTYTAAGRPGGEF